MKQIVICYIVATVMFLLTFAALNTGMDYISLGYGVTPIIMFPLGVIALYVGICFYNKADRLTLERKNK